MKRIGLIVLMVLANKIALAQPAVYTDGTLTVPNAAVVDEGGSSYFSDLVMQVESDGSFAFVSAESQSLVAVDEVTVSIMESLPVQVSVTVRGNKSVPCVNLLDPAIVQSELGYTIVLAESTLGPAETCIAVIDPFETTIALSVLGLAAGTYEVSVNGETASFTLTTDN